MKSVKNKNVDPLNSLFEQRSEIINKALVSEINKALKQLGSDYKHLSEVLDYGDYGYIYKVLHGQKKIKIATLVKISQGLINIKRNKKIKEVAESDLSPWALLEKALSKAFH